MVMVFASPALAVNTWFAKALNGQVINYTTGGAGWFQTQGTSCDASGTQLTWGNQAAGDNFIANGCVGITINSDPGPNGLVHLKNNDVTNAGGTFLIATATVPATVTADFTSGTAICLAISGNTAGSPVTTIGSSGLTGVTTGSATTASTAGINDSHIVGRIDYKMSNFVGGGVEVDGVHGRGGPSGVFPD